MGLWPLPGRPAPADPLHLHLSRPPPPPPPPPPPVGLAPPTRCLWPLLLCQPFLLRCPGTARPCPPWQGSYAEPPSHPHSGSPQNNWPLLLGTWSLAPLLQRVKVLPGQARSSWGLVTAWPALPSYVAMAWGSVCWGRCPPRHASWPQLASFPDAFALLVWGSLGQWTGLQWGQPRGWAGAVENACAGMGTPQWGRAQHGEWGPGAHRMGKHLTVLSAPFHCPRSASEADGLVPL